MKEGGDGARPSGQDQHDDAQLDWMHPEIDELHRTATWRVQTTTLQHGTFDLPQSTSTRWSNDYMPHPRCAAVNNDTDVIDCPSAGVPDHLGLDALSLA